MSIEFSALTVILMSYIKYDLAHYQVLNYQVKVIQSRGNLMVQIISRYGNCKSFFI